MILHSGTMSTLDWFLRQICTGWTSFSDL